MFEQGKDFIQRVSEPAKPVVKRVVKKYPFILAGMTGISFLGGCIPPHNPNVYPASPESKVSVSNASTSDILSQAFAEERSKNSEAKTTRMFPVETNIGTINPDAIYGGHGYFRNSKEPIPQNGDDIGRALARNREAINFLQDKDNLGVHELHLWNITRKDSDKTTISYKELVPTLVKLNATPDFQQFLRDQQDKLVKDGILKPGQLMKVEDFSKEALEKRFGDLQRQAFINRNIWVEREDGTRFNPVEWVRVSLLDQSTNEPLNIYSAQEHQYELSFATTIKGELIVILLSQRCGGQPQVPLQPPAKFTYPTATPTSSRRVVPTPPSTETATATVPALPTLPPFLTFTPTFPVPTLPPHVPNIPGQPNTPGQPENTATPGQPASTETPVPPTQPPRVESATPFPSATGAPLEPDKDVRTQTPVSTYVEPTKIPGQNTQVPQGTLVPVATEAPLEPKNDVKTVVPVSTEKAVVPTTIPGQNTAVPQKATPVPATPGSPQQQR